MDDPTTPAIEDDVSSIVTKWALGTLVTEADYPMIRRVLAWVTRPGDTLSIVPVPDDPTRARVLERAARGEGQSRSPRLLDAGGEDQHLPLPD